MKLTADWLLAALLLSFTTVQAQNKHISINKEPAWITRNAINYKNNKLDAQAEDGYIDMAFEKQVCLKEKSTFFKVAIKILSETGVENNSKISIEFEPSYQQVIFHFVRIIRGKNVINKLQLSKIKSLQQERELDKHLYNGSLTAVQILDDVRKGDMLEYSYTIKGVNPIFYNKYAEKYDTRFSVPVCQLFYKLIVPKERQVEIKNYGTAVQPSIISTPTETVYQWSIDDSPPLKPESDIPTWYDSYPMIMVSEYKSWKEVNDWALSLFTPEVYLSSSLQSQIEEIKNTNNTDDNRILAALRFVQDEIRYMGIEMGENSYKPHNPNQVLSQRFGDCKDKSYLFCTLLKAMNIEASPVLLNTVYKKTVTSWLPSPTSFDHTVVRVKFNSKYYWFDPTIMYQRGSLNDISFPDYQAGLVITNTTQQLTVIPLQDKGSIKAKEAFTVSDMSGNATLLITTNYTGSFADGVRSSYKSKSLSVIQKGYLDFYRSYFKKIDSDSLSYKENDQTGLFTTFEYYTLKEFWGPKNSLKEAVFEPYIINQIIKAPKETSTRNMPYELAYPALYDEEIEVQLPEKWSIKESLDKVVGPGFAFSAKYECTGNKVFMKYSYQNFKDHITPQEVKEFIGKMKEVDNHWSYSLSQSTQVETDSGALGGLFANNYSTLYMLLGAFVFITYLVRKKS